MSTRYAALTLSRALLRVLVVLNVLAGVGIAALFVTSLVAENTVFTALGVGPEARPFFGMRAIMIAGLAAVPLAYIVLRRLLAIVESVRDGDPFVAANAGHLQAIAWALLGLQLLHIAVGAIASHVESAGVDLDIKFELSISGWLSVLLAFVLARVFQHGTRMREDLAGTV